MQPGINSTSQPAAAEYRRGTGTPSLCSTPVRWLFFRSLRRELVPGSELFQPRRFPPWAPGAKSSKTRQGGETLLLLAPCCAGVCRAARKLTSQKKILNGSCSFNGPSRAGTGDKAGREPASP